RIRPAGRSLPIAGLACGHAEQCFRKHSILHGFSRPFHICHMCSGSCIPVLCPQSLVFSCTVSAVSGLLLYCVRSLWSSPVVCPQSLVISCTVSVFPCSLWSSPVVCLQSLVISCSMSAVSGHLP
ncbi:unnamed protein product, partial [Staurois parvus]